MDAVLLGEGTFGKVIKVTSKEKKHYAVKLLEINPGSENVLSKEINILKELKHINIVRYYADWKLDKTWFILMEYCDFTLRNLILEKVFLQNDKLCLKYLKEICSGLAFIHERGVLHLDLKPENILVAKDTVKIADFGLSKKCKIEACIGNHIYGTEVYIAPEILQSYNKMMPVYTDKVDMFAIGVILYEMVKPPLTIKAEYLSLVRYPEKHLLNTGINPNIAKMDLQLLSPNPLQRPSAAQLLKEIERPMMSIIIYFIIFIVMLILLICFFVMPRKKNRTSPMERKDIPVPVY